MSRPTRLCGFDYIGPYRYFLTICVRDRRDAFADAQVVAATLAQFRRIASRCQFAILAYCFMPDHVHVLVEGTSNESDVRAFVKRAKQASGQSYARCARGPLWQEGYYERVLRASEDAKQVARYIVANPIRAQLVATPFEYPHVGSDVWTLAELVGSVM